MSLSVFAGNPTVKELSDEEFNEYIIQNEKGMVVDVTSICRGLINCSNGMHLKYRDLLDFKISYKSDSSKVFFKIDNGALKLCYNGGYVCGFHSYSGSAKIKSNLPIIGITSATSFKIEHGRNLIYTHSNGSGEYKKDIDYKKSLSLTELANEISIRSVVITSTMTSFKPFYDQAKTPMRNAVKMIKRETLAFQRHMSKSDRNLDHFERFIVSLDDALAIIDDKKNYSVLDWRIQEGMRRVVSFGMIISDLLWAYEDVPGASRNIENIRMFRDELKATYGWQDTLAGTVSKTTSAILELLHYEISEIVKVKVEVGTDDRFGTYRAMTGEIRRLVAKINSSDGGDIVTGQHIGTFMELWNGDEWQEELGNLMEAKLDLRKLVRPKLKYVLNAVMALEELIDNRRVYFEIDVIAPTVDEQPSRG